MNVRSLFAPLALTAAMSMASSSAHAQAVDSCTVMMCMAGISGSGLSGGVGCVPATNAFFAIAIYDPSFDPGATSAARRTFLMTCPGVTKNPQDRAWVTTIISIWGEIP
jgi:hypothetical protein